MFDDKRSFTTWFDNFLSGQNNAGDSWMQKEKRLVVVHRLHQILEPFMLRRQVRGRVIIRARVI